MDPQEYLASLPDEPHERLRAHLAKFPAPSKQTDRLIRAFESEDDMDDGLYEALAELVDDLVNLDLGGGGEAREDWSAQVADAFEEFGA